jgi:hypothetical protein
MAFGRRSQTTEAASNRTETANGATTARTDPAYLEPATAAPRTRRGALAIPRSRGVVNGFAILILGIWGGIIPFVGPYFHYAYINYHGFSFPTYGRLWLDILPGALAVLAGLWLIGTANRATAAFAAVMAAVAGAWFLIGPSLSMLWNHGIPQTGPALGGTVLRTLEQLGYYYALGGVIVFLAAVVLGRVGVKSVRDVRAGEARSADPYRPRV